MARCWTKKKHQKSSDPLSDAIGIASQCVQMEAREEFKDLMGCAPWATESYRQVVDAFFPTKATSKEEAKQDFDLSGSASNVLRTPNKDKTVVYFTDNNNKMLTEKQVAKMFKNEDGSLVGFSNAQAPGYVPEDNRVYTFRTDLGQRMYWRDDGHKWTYVSTDRMEVNGAKLTRRRFFQRGNPFFEKEEYSSGQSLLADHHTWSTPYILVKYSIKPGGELLETKSSQRDRSSGA